MEEEGGHKDRDEESRGDVKGTTTIVENQEKKAKMAKSWKRCIVCVSSLMVSVVGGAILVLWEVKHHSTNSQLWMVPVGLILLATPAFIWASSFFSSDAICCTREDGCGGRNPRNGRDDGGGGGA